MLEIERRKMELTGDGSVTPVLDAAEPRGRPWWKRTAVMPYFLLERPGLVGFVDVSTHKQGLG